MICKKYKFLNQKFCMKVWVSKNYYFSIFEFFLSYSNIFSSHFWSFLSRKSFAQFFNSVPKSFPQLISKFWKNKFCRNFSTFRFPLAENSAERKLADIPLLRNWFRNCGTSAHSAGADMRVNQQSYSKWIRGLSLDPLTTEI